MRGQRGWVVERTEALSTGDRVHHFCSQVYGGEQGESDLPRELLEPFEHGRSILRGELEPELKRRLFEERERRPKPLRDDKAIASWNGLALAALAEAGRRLDRTEWLDAARALGEFLLGPLSDGDGHLLRSRRAAKRRVWIRVRMPGRPNGRTGWVRRDALGRLHVVRTALRIDRARSRATLRRRGLGILLVEQNAPAALELADRVHVMRAGRIRQTAAGGSLHLAAAPALHLGADEPTTSDEPEPAR